MLIWRADRQLAAMHFRSLTVGPKSLDRETRTVDAVLVTEAPVSMYDWSRLEVVPEILLADGAQLPGQIPLLDNHLRASVKEILGSVRSLLKSGQEVHGRLHFSSTVDKPFMLVTEGRLTAVSAGYRILQRTYVPAGSTKSISGEMFTGPVNVVTRWKLYELSLTSIGADEQAKLRGMGAIKAADIQHALEAYGGRGGNEVPEHPGNAPGRSPLTLAGLRKTIQEGIRMAYAGRGEEWTTH